MHAVFRHPIYTFESGELFSRNLEQAGGHPSSVRVQFRNGL
jgi:hypothetical protein